MSLLSPESLSVFVAPSELVLVHWRGLRPRIAEKRLCRVSATPDSPWAGAVRVFAEQLGEFAACRRVRVTLSDHFTHYQLQLWRDDLDDVDEELAVARLAYTQTYGDAAARWQIRLSDDAPGSAKIAAAVDTGLLAALEQAAGAAQMQLTSVQPYLAAAANHWHRNFSRERSAWLVLHEEGRLCIALIERGQWRWVRSLRVDADWPGRLPELLDDEMLLAGIDGPAAQVLIFSPAMPDLAFPNDTQWAFRSLRLDAKPNFSPVTDGRFGLALVG